MARYKNADLQWIREHEQEFINEYLNKYLLIRKMKIEGVFNNMPDASKNAAKKYGRAKYIIYHVINDKFINDINEKEEKILKEFEK